MLPRDLFYKGTDHYVMRLQTYFENTFRINAEVECRLPVCVDDVLTTEDEWIRFPVGRARR